MQCSLKKQCIVINHRVKTEVTEYTDFVRTLFFYDVYVYFIHLIIVYSSYSYVLLFLSVLGSVFLPQSCTVVCCYHALSTVKFSVMAILK